MAFRAVELAVRADRFYERVEDQSVGVALPLKDEQSDDIPAPPGMEIIVEVVGRLRLLEPVQQAHCRAGRYPWTRVDECNSRSPSGRWTCLCGRRAPLRWRGSARVNDCNS